LRTLPNYYLILAIYVILSLSAATASPSPIWKFLSFTQNMGIPNAFTPSWSLCVEEQFYLAFPMVVLVLARRRSPRLVVLALASILALGLILRTAIWFACRPDRLPSASALAAYMANLYFPTYCRLDGITCGVALAAVKCFRPAIWQRLTARPNALLAGSGLFFTASILAFWTRYTLFCSTLGFTLISASFTLLTAHVLSGRRLIGSRNIPGTATVALLSYAIYLTHSLAIECAERLVTAWGVTVQSAPGVAVATTLIVVFASVLYYVVERPCLRLRDQFFGKKKSPRWEKALVPIAEAGN
jgi:peptidoglycan/LPS O-acetylase OafA/YrhL